jgi:Tfp pilus assembly protein PilV
MGIFPLFSMDKLLVLTKSLRNTKGLSLLETLIAIIILAVSLASISYFFSTSRSHVEFFGRMRCGLVLAHDKMERLKDLGYSHDDLSDDNNPHWDRVDSAGNAAADGEFYREWTVTDIPDPADGTGDAADYKLVELEVYDQRLVSGGDLADPNKLVAELKTYISH